MGCSFITKYPLIKKRPQRRGRGRGRSSLPRVPGTGTDTKHLAENGVPKPVGGVSLCSLVNRRKEFGLATGWPLPNQIILTKCPASSSGFFVCVVITSDHLSPVHGRRGRIFFNPMRRWPARLGRSDDFDTMPVNHSLDLARKAS